MRSAEFCMEMDDSMHRGSQARDFRLQAQIVYTPGIVGSIGIIFESGPVYIHGQYILGSSTGYGVAEWITRSSGNQNIVHSSIIFSIIFVHFFSRGQFHIKKCLG